MATHSKSAAMSAHSIGLRNVSNETHPDVVGDDKVKKNKKITIRSHSKAIYYYPTVLLALTFALLVPENGTGIWGNVFLPLFFCNTIVVLFDFSSLRTLFLSLVAMVVGLALWSFDLLSYISPILSVLHLEMNSHVYFMFAFFFGLLIIGDFIWSHLNRWEFSANEVKHIQAFAGHSANYPGRGLRFQVRTVDVFERLLLGAGTIVLRVGKSKVRIQNVIFAHKQVRDLERFVRTTGVFDDGDDVFDDEDDDDHDF